ncbi:MAG: protein phosphatase 2C domain-containing protein [Albidovulum sp.]
MPTRTGCPTDHRLGGLTPPTSVDFARVPAFQKRLQPAPGMAMSARCMYRSWRRKMFWQLPEPNIDVASAISQGSRDYQEDAIITDFPIGADYGMVVLADGMGGHAAGDVASKTIVTEVFRQLKFKADCIPCQDTNIPALLGEAATAANVATMRHIAKHPDAAGMGATLVSTVFIGNRLYWMSIGDSPLFHFRNGKLAQLNEDHSLSPQIDFLVKSGMMDAETGKNHPNRNCLTSVIMGEDIAKKDCPAEPFEIKEGDIFIIASDGLQYLDDAQIEKILHKNRKQRCSEIARTLLASVEALKDPDQDNVTISVVKINKLGAATKQKAPASKISNFQHSPVSQPQAANTGNVGQIAATTGYARKSSGSRFARASNGQ